MLSPISPVISEKSATILSGLEREESVDIVLKKLDHMIIIGTMIG